MRRAPMRIGINRQRGAKIATAAAKP